MKYNPCRLYVILKFLTDAYTCFNILGKQKILTTFILTGATQGKTSRSRAIISQGLIPCNDKLWETKICPATDCTSFSWVASPWTNGKREVSCQTSDGLRVNKGKTEVNIWVSVKVYIRPKNKRRNMLVLRHYCIKLMLLHWLVLLPYWIGEP